MRDDEYKRIFESEDSFWWYVGIHSLIEDSLRKYLAKKNGNILDAGCGTGGNLMMLKRFAKAFGIDISPEALRFCSKSRGLTDLTQGTLEQLPFRNDSFDAAISIDVLYHLWVRNDETALRELYRVLKPGGIIIIQSAAFEWLRGQHDEVVYTRKRFTRNEVCQKLSSAGFSVKFASYRNTLLFPIVFIVRVFKKKGEASSSDVSMPSPFINSILRFIMKTENVLLRFVRFPIGSSVYAIATKEAT